MILLPDMERMLGDAIGLDTRALGPCAVADAVSRRMAACGLTAPAEYRARIAARSEEFQALVEAVVVPETWFFRDGEPFRCLGDYAAGAWRSRHPRGCLRVLSAPCSTGEEPYSMAIALREAGLDPDGAPGYRLEAADISTACLERARRGVYGPNAFRGTPLNGHARYFRREGGAWVVRPELRAGIRFRQANLLAPESLAAEAPYDVVFCRNLLIYLLPPARQRVVESLDRLLRPGGLLIVGHAEQLPLLDARFESLRIPGAFAYRKPGPAAPPAPAAFSAPAVRSAPPVLAVPPLPPPRPPDPAAPAAAWGVRLARARALADRGCLAEAAAACEALARDAPARPEAHFLLGVLREAAGDPAAAEACFNRTLYLAADHAEALAHLALLKARRGDAEGAERLRRRAARARAAAGEAR